MSKQRGEARVLNICQHQSLSFSIFSIMVGCFFWRCPSEEWVVVSWLCSRNQGIHCNAFCICWRAEVLSTEPRLWLFWPYIYPVYSPLTLIWWRLPFGIFVVAISCDQIIIAKHWSVARSATETGAKPAPGSKSLAKGSCVAQGSKPVERFRRAFGHIYRWMKLLKRNVLC